MYTIRFIQVLKDCSEESGKCFLVIILSRLIPTWEFIVTISLHGPSHPVFYLYSYFFFVTVEETVQCPYWIFETSICFPLNEILFVSSKVLPLFLSLSLSFSHSLSLFLSLIRFLSICLFCVFTISSQKIAIWNIPTIKFLYDCIHIKKTFISFYIIECIIKI